jgi:opacity protein-like surface antigen
LKRISIIALVASVLGLLSVPTACRTLAYAADEFPPVSSPSIIFEDETVAEPAELIAKPSSPLDSYSPESSPGERVESTGAPSSLGAIHGQIEQTLSKIPEFLPEGILPPITGQTKEEHRHYGIGEPLEGSSWLACSHSAGTFFGAIGGATLIDNKLEQGGGGIFGLRFGFDYDHHWGVEKRFGFAQMNVLDLFSRQRQIVNLELGDIDLLFYPWGDTRWRPYISMGVGLAHFNYQSDSGRRLDRLLVGLPFGIGVKYFWNDGVAIRVEMVDNLMLGAHELSTMNNVSLALGIEFRYSGFHLGGKSQP